jgi:hypothetical protein
MIPRVEMQVSINTDWVISIKITHKPTGLIGLGSDQNNSRKAYAIALKDLEQQISNKGVAYARLL